MPSTSLFEVRARPAVKRSSQPAMRASLPSIRLERATEQRIAIGADHIGPHQRTRCHGAIERHGAEIPGMSPAAVALDQPLDAPANLPLKVRAPQALSEGAQRRGTGADGFAGD